MADSQDRPRHWLHDRISFFKYTTREAVGAILRNRTLRWSSPAIFNDPFDMQFDMHVDTDPGDLARIRQLTLDSLWEAHYSTDGLAAGNLLGDIIKAVRPFFPKLTREEFDSEYGAACDESLQKLPAQVSKLNLEFREKMKGAKLLCLSERRESILMWSHYAELHKGVVLEFACVPEIDSTWGAAIPVRYYDKMPRMFDQDFLIRFGSGQIDMKPEGLVSKFVTAKAEDWAYEREWRVVLYGTDPNQTTQEIRFSPVELAAIYFGCQMPADDKAEIAAIVRRDYPGTRVFAAKKMDREFGLEFSDYQP